MDTLLQLLVCYDCLWLPMTWRQRSLTQKYFLSTGSLAWSLAFHLLFCSVMRSLYSGRKQGNKHKHTHTHTHTHTHKHTLNAPIEEIENRTVTMKRDKEADNADQEERRIQRRLEEKRRILEMQRWRRKKRRKKRKEGKSLLNDCKFSKTKLSKLVLTTFDGIHFDWFRFWNQFEIQIDKCDLPQVSNFLTLKSW